MEGKNVFQFKKIVILLIIHKKPKNLMQLNSNKKEEVNKCIFQN